MSNFNVQYTLSLAGKYLSQSKSAQNAFKRMGDAAEKNGKRMSRSLQRAGKGMRRLVNSSDNLITRLVGVAGVTAAIMKTIQAGSNFQDSMADLSAITGAGGKELEFFSNSARTISKQFGTSSAEIAASFKLIASGKSELLKDPAGLVEVGKQALILSKATGISLESMSGSLVGALNQFGAGAAQSSRFINVLAAGSKLGASEVGETAEVVKRAGVQARLAGVGFEEFNSVIQVLAKQGGLKGAEVGAQLKTALLALETEKNVSKKGLIPVLRQLGKERLNAAKLEKLFGRESLAVGKILIDNVDLVKDWTKAFTGTSIAQEQAAIRMKTFSFRMSVLKAKMEDTFIRVFMKAEPAITRLTEKVSGFFESMSNEEVEGFADSLTGIAYGLGAIGKALGFVLLKFGQLAKIYSDFFANFEGDGFLSKLGSGIGKYWEGAKQMSADMRGSGDERKKSIAQSAASEASKKFETAESHMRTMTVIGESRQKMEGQVKVVIEDKTGKVSNVSSSSSGPIPVATELNPGVGFAN